MLYNLVVIGEAAAQLSDGTRANAPEIPWSNGHSANRQPCLSNLLLGRPKGARHGPTPLRARAARPKPPFRDPLANLHLQAENEHEGLVYSP